MWWNYWQRVSCMRLHHCEMTGDSDLAISTRLSWRKRMDAMSNYIFFNSATMLRHTDTVLRFKPKHFSCKYLICTLWLHRGFQDLGANINKYDHQRCADVPRAPCSCQAAVMQRCMWCHARCMSRTRRTHVSLCEAHGAVHSRFLELLLVFSVLSLSLSLSFFSCAHSVSGPRPHHFALSYIMSFFVGDEAESK